MRASSHCVACDLAESFLKTGLLPRRICAREYRDIILSLPRKLTRPAPDARLELLDTADSCEKTQLIIRFVLLGAYPAIRPLFRLVRVA